MYRYYTTLRPAAPGAIPDGAVYVENFDERTFELDAGCAVWSVIEYEKPLSTEQINAYELAEGGKAHFVKLECVIKNGDYSTAKVYRLSTVYSNILPPDLKRNMGGGRWMHTKYFDCMIDASDFIERYMSGAKQI